jgi:hypothetical protein
MFNTKSSGFKFIWQRHTEARGIFNYKTAKMGQEGNAINVNWFKDIKRGHTALYTFPYKTVRRERATYTAK